MNVGKLGNLFGGGSSPPPPPVILPALPPPTPSGPTEAEKEAARQQRLAEKRRVGRRATILTDLETDADELGASVKRPSATGPAKTGLG